ncbi:PREDICTED: DNA repair protein XRCC2 isoform X2 [Poecilia mexicana]|uniref:DNA repair protein XRCC2 isoform X2 n=1 Tax=Poecilia mexicana TaxID=48701 RepID=UPI00072E3FA4|nr:PREDICTED: DNA repair protein XRCC2 isoform X2 [Poecilia mexicana]
MSESGTQLFARLEARRCLKDVEPRLFADDGGPDRGKTELLYHLLCRCVLPEAAGGLEVDVVFVDTDYSLDMFRLASVLDSRLNAGGSAGSDDAVLRSCLSRLLVVRCSSSSQLLLTLHFLETTLSSRPRAALLLIDSISAFYWSDRSEAASVAKQEEKLSRCSELLGRLLRDYRITIFATCHPIRRGSNGPPSSSEADRSHLCRAWQRLVTHRLVCSRQEAQHNPANGDERSGEQRNWQVFTVHCSSWTGTRGSRVSSFRVTDGGVEFIWTPRPPPDLSAVL